VGEYGGGGRKTKREREGEKKEKDHDDWKVQELCVQKPEMSRSESIQQMKAELYKSNC
jgi:hypothetical protein